MSDQTEATRQSDDIKAPLRGEIIALAIDGTARAYDLAAIVLDGTKFRAQHDHVYLSLFNDGANTIYFQTSDATHNDLDDTAVITAGNALAYANTYAIPIHASASIDIRIDRLNNRWLIVKCASVNTSTLRFYASSQSTFARGQGA